MSEEKDIKEEFEQLDKEFVEMVNKAENAKELTKEEIEKLLKEAKGNLEFLKLIDNIKIPEERYVVYTDGDLQLLYENGEFFLVSTTDSKAEKKKIKRKQAIDSYLEYFIKYQINPIIEKRKHAMLKREINMAEKTRTRRKNVKTNQNIEFDKEEKSKELEKEETFEKKKDEKVLEKDIER